MSRSPGYYDGKPIGTPMRVGSAFSVGAIGGFDQIEKIRRDDCANGNNNYFARKLSKKGQKPCSMCGIPIGICKGEHE